MNYKVFYTKSLDNTTGSIIVKARNKEEAIANAKDNVATGSNFRDAEITEEKYSKPRKQGFFGYN
jgi:hypothetical protein